MGRRGQPMYQPHRVHVVRFFADGQLRTWKAHADFNTIRRRIREKYGNEVAASAASWGWQSEPINGLAGLRTLFTGLSLPAKVGVVYAGLGVAVSAINAVDRYLAARRVLIPTLKWTPTLPRDSLLNLVAWPYTLYQWAAAGYLPVVTPATKEYTVEELRARQIMSGEAKALELERTRAVGYAAAATGGQKFTKADAPAPPGFRRG